LDYWTVLRAEDTVLDSVDAFVQSVEEMILGIEKDTHADALGVPKCEENHTRADGKGCVDERYLELPLCNLTNAPEPPNNTNASANATKEDDCPCCKCEKCEPCEKEAANATANATPNATGNATNGTNGTNGTNATNVTVELPKGPLCADTTRHFGACWADAGMRDKFPNMSIGRYENGRVNVPCLLVAEPKEVEAQFAPGCTSFVKGVRTGFTKATVLVNDQGDAKLVTGVKKRFDSMCKSKHRLESWQCEAHAAPLFSNTVSPEDWCKAFWKDYYPVVKLAANATLTEGPPDSGGEGSDRLIVDGKAWGVLPNAKELVAKKAKEDCKAACGEEKKDEEKKAL